MGGFNATHSFSYNMRDREVIVEAEKTATKLGLSFSAYLIKCLKADLGIGESQKKGEGTSKCPVHMEEKEEAEYIPTITSERIDIFNFVKSMTDTRELGKVIGNGKFMASVSQRKINEIKVSTRL